MPGVSPGSELTGAGALSAATHRSPARADQGGVARPGYTLPAQLSVPGIATIASVASVAPTMARVAADTDLGHVHLSCYYANQLTHKLQLSRKVIHLE